MDNNETLLLNLRIGMWGISRSLADSDYDVDADKTMTRASKKILEAPEYKYLLQIKRSVQATLHAMALPGSYCRPGFYPLSLPMVEAVETVLAEFGVKWEVAREALGQNWDMRVEEAKASLRGLYDEKDYPTWDRVVRRFSVYWSYLEVTVPRALKETAPGVYRRELVKWTKEKEAMVQEIRMGLRVTFQELVAKLVDTLTPNADGGKKRLVTVDPMLNFMEDFLTKKNVSEDEELQQLVEQAKRLLMGVSGSNIERLRKENGIREVVATGMAGIKQVLDGLVEEAPREMWLRD